MPALHECERWILLWALLNTRLLCGEIGRLTGRARNRPSNARQFSSRGSPFFLGGGGVCFVIVVVVVVVVVYFVLFSPVSFLFFFFFNIKLSQQLHIRGLLFDDGYQTIIYNQDLNITEPYSKKTSFSKIYIYKIVIHVYIYIFSCHCMQFFRPAFFHPHFPILIFSSSFCHPHPSSAGIRYVFYRHPFERNSSLEYYQMSCVGKTKHTS